MEEEKTNLNKTIAYLDEKSTKKINHLEEENTNLKKKVVYLEEKNTILEKKNAYLTK